METESIDNAFKAKEEEIKAVVAEITKAESGIEKHQQGIASLTPTLIVAQYRLGKLLMSLPGASGELRKARGAWLKKAGELCGNKDRVYFSRDVVSYFDDPLDSKVRASGTTGEERAEAFRGTLAELEKLVGDKKYHETEKRRLERQREWREAEAEKRASRSRESTAVQGAAARMAPRPSGENDNSFEAEAHEPGSRTVDYFAQLREAKLRGDHDDEKEKRDDRAVAASEFIGLFGGDVQQAVAYMIDHHWNRGDATSWLVGCVSNKLAAMGKSPKKKPATAKKPADKKRADDPQAVPASTTA